jgi:hypothetical protein
MRHEPDHLDEGELDPRCPLYPRKQMLTAAFVRASPSGSEAPRRFSGGALRSVRWGEVLSSVIGSQASTESKF